MSKLPLFTLLCLVLSLLIGCANKQPDSAIQQKTTPFESDNKAILFSQIEAKVDSAIKASEIRHSESSIIGYNLWDSVANALYSPDLYNLKSDSQFARHRNGIIEYLNWHLRRIINTQLADSQIRNALNLEYALTDSLLSAQYKWFQSHFDATQDYLGSASNLKYYNLEIEMLRLRNANLKELLIALTDTAYCAHTEHIISADLFLPEYHHILSQCIPYYSNDTVYNEDTDRQNFIAETNAWQQLIDKRTQISNFLSGKVKDAFNSGTYRLMFNRLRQLKNEFESYPIMTVDRQSLTLSDSCTYQELLAYPNFSTMWNEYQKQFER